MGDETLCPACILEFIKDKGPSALGSELDDIFSNEVVARRCENHQDTNIFIDLNELRVIHNVSPR